MDCTVLFVQKLMVIVKDKHMGGGGRGGQYLPEEMFGEIGKFLYIY